MVSTRNGEATEPPRLPNSPSFLPPTKSIPSSMAFSMNGVVAFISSDIARAFLHSASATFCGMKGDSPLLELGRDVGGVGSPLAGVVLTVAEAEDEGVSYSSSRSRTSSSYCRSARCCYTRRAVTDKIIHQPITADDYDIVLLHLHFHPIRVFHWFIPLMSANLIRKVESVL
jgi:hypothetical protein